MKPVPVETLKTPLRKSESGTTGSAARRSCRTNSTTSTAPPAKRPTIVAEAHAYCTPPHVSPSVIAAAAPARRIVPSTSMRCDTRSPDFGSTAATMTSATAATGTFT